MKKSSKKNFDLSGCVYLLRKSKSLLLFSLVGAAVLQLDKPLIASFISASDVSTYFLAVTYCMLPISLLASPVAQYFQPQLITLLANGHGPECKKMLYFFTFTLITITTLSSQILWIYREFWIELWLHKSPSSLLISSYVEILLPAVVIGALGYIPYTLLVAHEDYKFQSLLAVTISAITLTLVLYFAADKNIFAICWVYAGYHILSTFTSWIRAITIRKIRNYGSDSLILSVKLVTLLFSITLVIYLLLNSFISGLYQPILFSIIVICLGFAMMIFFTKLRFLKNL